MRAGIYRFFKPEARINFRHALDSTLSILETGDVNKVELSRRLTLNGQNGEIVEESGLELRARFNLN
ncbi:MAG: hypothetical protein H0W76_03000 [Pyrinomonadaceae bacterium]|nr:hypothetical protein [Pyrinomonadaceae bacterium]